MTTATTDLAISGAESCPWPRTTEDFEALFNRLQHRLVRYAFSRLRSLADAEDVVQEIVMRAYRSRAKYEHAGNADALLFRMVANGCTDRHRRRRRTSALDELPEEPLQHGDDAFDLLRIARRRRWLEGLFNQLPTEQAEAVRLRIYGELPFEAVAEAVGCSLAAAKARFRYGIRRLRQEIGTEVSYDL